MKRIKQAKRNDSSKKSRKEIRKEMRKQKKTRRHEYYTNRYKGGRFVLNPENITSNSDAFKKIITKSPKATRIKNKVLTVEEEHQKTLQREKQKHERLKIEMAKQRKLQLQKANDEEDMNIKRLEKQLGLKKRKSNSAPKSFAEDGLDYLLEVCNSDNMKAAVTTEQEMARVNDDFEEDFALMTGNVLTKNNEGSATEESDIEMENDFSDNHAEEEIEENLEDDDGNSDMNSEEDSLESDGFEDNCIEIENHGSENGNLSSNSNNDVNYEKDTLENDGFKDTDENLKNDGMWEDIYGRLRGKDGQVINVNQEKYIPPSIRAKMELVSSSNDSQREERLNRLRKQLKGLLNRVAENNMHSIATQIEELYMKNSRNEMNDTLTSLILDSTVTPVLSLERFLLDHILLITILHANVGTEVGAHFLQVVVKKFNQLFEENYPVENKMLDNVVWIIAQLFNNKVAFGQLIYDILTKLSNRFTEADIECILLVLKNVGFSLRKDDPKALKSLILVLQKQASNASAEIKQNPRVKFMLDILLAIKNNNMSKIPNYDVTYSEHLKKLLKTFVRKGCYVTTLNISLEDLSKADLYGKWWIVGSAWTGKSEESEVRNSDKQDGYSQTLLDLASKQRMSTDARRNIFCIIMSAEDYLDAFEKLLHLGLKNQQEREIINVILHCCLQEKTFNPYYAVLAQKFCEYDRKFQMTIKYSVWDKLKTLNECSAPQLSNLAKLLTHLFLEKGLSISTLKIIQFGELDRITLRFMRQVLIGILLCSNNETCQSVFVNIVQSEKLKMFKESLRLFIQHFVLRNLSSESISVEQKQILEERSKTIDKLLSISDKKLKF